MVLKLIYIRKHGNNILTTWWPKGKNFRSYKFMLKFQDFHGIIRSGLILLVLYDAMLEP